MQLYLFFSYLVLAVARPSNYLGRQHQGSTAARQEEDGDKQGERHLVGTRHHHPDYGQHYHQAAGEGQQGLHHHGHVAAATW